MSSALVTVTNERSEGASFNAVSSMPSSWFTIGNSIRGISEIREQERIPLPDRIVRLMFIDECRSAVRSNDPDRLDAMVKRIINVQNQRITEETNRFDAVTAAREAEIRLNSVANPNPSHNPDEYRKKRHDRRDDTNKGIFAQYSIGKTEDDVRAFVIETSNLTDTQIQEIQERNNPRSENYSPELTDYIYVDARHPEVANLTLELLPNHLRTYVESQNDYRNSTEVANFLHNISQALEQLSRESRQIEIQQDRENLNQDQVSYERDQEILLREATRIGLDIEPFEYSNTRLRSLISLRLSEDPQDSFVREMEMIELAANDDGLSFSYGNSPEEQSRRKRYESMTDIDPTIRATQKEADMLRSRVVSLHDEFVIWNESLEQAIKENVLGGNRDITLLQNLNAEERRQYWISLQTQNISRGYERLEAYLGERQAIRGESMRTPSGDLVSQERLQELFSNGTITQEQFSAGERVHHCRAAIAASRIRTFNGFLPVIEGTLDRFQQEGFSHRPGANIDFQAYFGPNFDPERIDTFDFDNLQLPVFDGPRADGQKTTRTTLESVRPAEREHYEGLSYMVEHNTLVRLPDGTARTSGADVHPVFRREHDRATELTNQLSGKKAMGGGDIGPEDLGVLVNRLITRAVVDTALSYGTELTHTRDVSAGVMSGDNDRYYLTNLADRLTNGRFRLTDTTRAAEAIRTAHQAIRGGGRDNMDGMAEIDIAFELNPANILATTNKLGDNHTFGGVGQEAYDMDTARLPLTLAGGERVNRTSSATYIENLRTQLVTNETRYRDNNLSTNQRRYHAERARSLRIRIRNAETAMHLEVATFYSALVGDAGDVNNPFNNLIDPNGFFNRLPSLMRQRFQELGFSDDQLTWIDTVGELLNSPSNPFLNAGIYGPLFFPPMGSWWIDHMHLLEPTPTGGTIDLSQFISGDQVDINAIGRLVQQGRLRVRWQDMDELGVDVSYRRSRERIGQALVPNPLRRSQQPDIPQDLAQKMLSQAQEIWKVYSAIGKGGGEIDATPSKQFMEGVDAACGMAFNLPDRDYAVMFLRAVAGSVLRDPTDPTTVSSAREPKKAFELVRKGYFDLAFCTVMNLVRDYDENGRPIRVFDPRRISQSVTRLLPERRGRNPLRPGQVGRIKQTGYTALRMFARFNMKDRIGEDPSSPEAQEIQRKAYRETAQILLGTFLPGQIFALFGYRRDEFPTEKAYQDATDQLYMRLVEYAGFDVLTDKDGNMLWYTDPDGIDRKPILINRYSGESRRISTVYISTPEMAAVFGEPIGTRVGLNEKMRNQYCWLARNGTQLGTFNTPLGVIDRTQDLTNSIASNIGLISSPEALYGLITLACGETAGIRYSREEYQANVAPDTSIPYPQTNTQKSMAFQAQFESMWIQNGLADEGIVSFSQYRDVDALGDIFLGGNNGGLLNIGSSRLVISPKRTPRALIYDEAPRPFIDLLTWIGVTLDMALLDPEMLAAFGAEVDGRDGVAMPAIDQLYALMSSVPTIDNINVERRRLADHNGNTEQIKFLSQGQMTEDKTFKGRQELAIATLQGAAFRPTYFSPYNLKMTVNIWNAMQWIFGIKDPKGENQAAKAGAGFVGQVATVARTLSGPVKKFFELGTGSGIQWIASSIIVLGTVSLLGPLSWTAVGLGLAAYAATGITLGWTVDGYSDEDKVTRVQSLAWRWFKMRRSLWTPKQSTALHNGIAIPSASDLLQRRGS